jgi:hypothetical protein
MALYWTLYCSTTQNCCWVVCLAICLVFGLSLYVQVLQSKRLGHERNQPDGKGSLDYWPGPLYKIWVMPFGWVQMIYAGSWSWLLEKPAFCSFLCPCGWNLAYADVFSCGPLRASKHIRANVFPLAENVVCTHSQRSFISYTYLEYFQ